MGIIDWDTAFDTTETKQLPDHFSEASSRKDKWWKIKENGYEFESLDTFMTDVLYFASENEEVWELF